MATYRVLPITNDLKEHKWVATKTTPKGKIRYLTLFGNWTIFLSHAYHYGWEEHARRDLKEKTIKHVSKWRLNV